VTLALHAPIRPGASAAGIALGSEIETVLATCEASTVVAIPGGTIHDFGPVKVWSRDRKIHQIGVYAGYAWTLDGAIRVGSTIAEVETHFRCAVIEDDDDVLIVPGSPGWCFETEVWSGHRLSENRLAQVTGIFVNAQLLLP
jgi:hypothetical protein